MDPNDQSPGVVDDDSCTDGNSRLIQKSETDSENIHLPSSTNEKSNENNDPRLEKRSENGHSVDVTNVKKRKIQNESREVEEGGSPVCPIDKGSEMDVSQLDGYEYLKTSASMLSFTSTAATCGSSSDGMSVDEELLDDPEEISEKCEQDFSKSRLGLLFAGVESISDSSTTSCFDTDRANQSQETDCVSTGAAESSLQEDSNPLKSPEKGISLETVETLSSPKERRSNNLESDGFSLETRLSSTLSIFADIENLPSKNTAAVPPLLEKANSSSTTEDEKDLDCGATGGFDDLDSNRHNYYHKEDKSVRRKVKMEPPTTSFAESVSDNTRKIGHSLLGIAKSMESTSNEGRFHKYYGRGHKVIFSSKAWLNDIFSAYHQTENADTTPKLDTECLLKEVKNFFQNHEVDVDVNMGWAEIRHQIVTTQYFSDEFSRSHGLLTFVELHDKWEKDLKRDSARFLSNQLKMLELCRTLKGVGLSEQAFNEYVEKRYRDVESNTECFSVPSDLQFLQSYDYSRLYCIEEDIGFGVMLELYEKLAGGGSSINMILNESEANDATELSPRSREQPSTSENSSQIQYESLAGNQGTFYMPFNRARDMSRHIGCTSSIEGCVPKNDEPAAESSQEHLKESKETSNVNLELESNVSNSSIRPKNEICIEVTSLLPKKSVVKFESGNEQSTDKEASNASAKDLD